MKTYKEQFADLVKELGANNGNEFSMPVNLTHYDGSERCTCLAVEGNELFTYWESLNGEDYLDGWVRFENIAPSELDTLLELLS